jgi:hypothetical protein
VRLLRSKGRDPEEPLGLPEVSDDVVLGVRGAGWIPARVIERGPDALVIAITVRMRELTTEQLETMKVEFVSTRGRVRVGGTAVSQDPASPELITVTSPRSVDVLQEREYVRIKSARPVLVCSAREGVRIQSFTVDVSGGGLLLAGPDTLAAGDELSFELTLKPGEAPVSGRGRVVRVDAHGRRAVEFVSISDLHQRRLVHFIFECQREERRRGLEAEDRG